MHKTQLTLLCNRIKKKGVDAVLRTCDELMELYKIGRKEDDLKDDSFDIVIVQKERGPAHVDFLVLRNRPGICAGEMAIVGDLCDHNFGLVFKGNGVIRVYTD